VPFVAAVLTALAVCQLATLVTTVYLHRALSHRALTLAPAATMALRVILWVTTGIRPRQWVAVHRKHHAFTDVDGDPHSPLLEGFAMVQFGNVVLYRRALAADGGALVDRYAKDLPPDAWDRRLFDRPALGLAIGIGLLCLVLGPFWGLFAAVLHTATYLLANAAINAIGHWRGSRPHANAATNNQWLALLTMGEGLHNNHHAAPTSARMALQRGELDPAWPVIRLLERCGQATVRLDRERVLSRLG
jgi:stearoyl-CoA desaturase (delta-9 desaturase)